MNGVRISTPSRLHFGLLGWGPHASRQFGGVGLMIERPGLEILVEGASKWEAIGPLRDRALDIAIQVADHLRQAHFEVCPARISILKTPSAHIGLGLGTQLSLAIARALATIAEIPQTPATSLAHWTGRGRRSGIGIHGFAEGGLIVDVGQSPISDLPVKLTRLAFPSAWSILIILPDQQHGLHGQKELNAFASLPPLSGPESDRLCRLVLLGLLPGVIETDLSGFGSSLVAIQEIMGRVFGPAQGGRFGSREAEKLGETLTRMGLHGVGQSSWGPTLYAFSDLSESAREILRSRLINKFNLKPDTIFWTQASAAGAIVESL